MSKGPATLRRIDAEVRKLRDEEADVERQIAEAGSRIAAMRTRELEAFRQLAVFRLDQDGAAAVGRSLDRAEKELRRLRAARDKALQGLAEQIAAADADIDRLEAERVRLTDEIAELRATVEEADARLIARLSEDAGYQARIAEVEAAERVALEAERKAELAREDRTEKGRPYEDDSLFMYLWKRGFGTSEYRGRGLVRMLDRWVARLVRFQEARPNYHMLLELPERLGEHAERARAAAETEADRLEDFEAGQRAAAGILDQAKKLAADEAALADLARNVIEQATARTALEAKRAAINRGEDEASREAIEALVSALRDTRLSQLHRAAMLTPDPADERLVEEIDDLREDIEDREHDLERLQRVERDLEHKLAELAELRGRFVGERYDDERWEFDDDMVEDVLKGLLRGAINAAVVWAQLRRRGRYTPGPSRPSSGDVWGRPSRGGGTIFRPRPGRSGGFGRGGFRTGGGFGGGFGGGRGGFRTGGKF
ncbi:hypothetical protein [Microbaculum marinum]|uniref:Uncharacterized protein n=1 Tax=Microbaculum marinum TaxID=1764581 RepID=A0AAW9RGP5_9HYPH